MKRIERGTVVDAAGGTARVRLAASAACADCASAGRCLGAGGAERLLEARNGVGAAVGDAVRVRVERPAAASPAVSWGIVAALLLAGAALATLLAGPLLPPSLAAKAPGVGGIVGALAGVLVARRLRRRLRDRGAAAAPAEIEVIEAPARVDSAAPRG